MAYFQPADEFLSQKGKLWDRMFASSNSNLRKKICPIIFRISFYFFLKLTFVAYICLQIIYLRMLKKTRFSGGTCFFPLQYALPTQTASVATLWTSLTISTSFYFVPMMNGWCTSILPIQELEYFYRGY